VISPAPPASRHLAWFARAAVIHFPGDFVIFAFLTAASLK
jgi:hypothetical protein